jgi:hypothetical protein
MIADEKDEVELPKDSKRHGIIDFIFRTNYYNRMIAIEPDCGFETYEEFKEHNINCVNKLTDKYTKFIIKLIKNIKKNKIMQTDEESFIEFSSAVIYFNINGKIVIMNRR